jgi:hypothetical protein
MIPKQLPKKESRLDGRWKVWESATNSPDGRFPDPMESYLVACDCAGGIVGRNKSVITVLSMNRHEQVAVLAGTYSPEETAHQAAMAGYFFNMGEVIVEVQTHGAVVINLLLREYRYPKIYRHNLSITGWKTNTSMDYGWKPGKQGFGGSSNRQLAIDLLARSVGFNLSESGVERAKAIKINDPETIKEMEYFVRDKKTGKEQAAPGKMDDRVSALYIAEFVWNERQKPLIEQAQQPESTVWDRMKKWAIDHRAREEDESRTFGGAWDD